MNSEVQNFEKLLVKYKLAQLKPAKVQNSAISSGRKNLVQILKKTGHYSIIFALTYKLYYIFKGLGINVTIFQTKIILLVVSVNAAASFAVGGLYVKKFYLNKILTDSTSIVEEIGRTEKIADPAVDNIVDGKKITAPKKMSSKSLYAIGIAKIPGDTGDVLKITSQIYKDLTGRIGQNKIIFLNNKNKGKVEKILTGSIRQVGKEKFLTIKLVNVEDSRIIVILSENINSEKEIESACSKISESISKMYLQ